jgi:hypothetical protein
VSLEIILLLVWLHFFCDFILQSDRVAKGKSKDGAVLLEHVLIYGAPFLIIGLEYATINAVLHGAVDFVTSRMTSRLWAQGRRHWFFVTIGFDQALHLTCLFVTYKWLMEIT